MQDTLHLNVQETATIIAGLHLVSQSDLAHVGKLPFFAGLEPLGPIAIDRLAARLMAEDSSPENDGAQCRSCGRELGTLFLSDDGYCAKCDAAIPDGSEY